MARVKKSTSIAIVAVLALAVVAGGLVKMSSGVHQRVERSPI